MEESRRVHYGYMDTPVQQIKDKLNITDVVGSYVTLKRSGRTFIARCPFHSEKTPSFHVSPERGTYKCFGCGEGGDIFSFVEKMEGVDFAGALKLLGERAGVDIKQKFSRSPEHKEHDERLREVCEAAVLFFELALSKRKDVVEYLHSRGVTDDTIKHWRLGYAPPSWEELAKQLVAEGFTKNEIIDAGFAVKSEKKSGDPMNSSSEIRVFDRFRGRIMFPIFDTTGRAIAVSGRFFERVPGQKDDTEPAKYVNSPETELFKKSKILYGFNHAKAAIRKADCVLLVEGQFDLVLAHQSGLPFTVALSGTALTGEHLSLLSRLSKRLVLALDADLAGVRAGLRSAHLALGNGFDVKIPTFPEGKDPADIARENPELLKAAIRTSTTAVEFFMQTLHREARDERAYKKVVEAQVLPLIAAMASKIEQEHFVRIVAAKIGVSEAAVTAEVAKIPGASAEKVLEPAAPRVVDTKIDETPLERAIAILITKLGTSSEQYSRLVEVVGAPRLKLVKESIGNDTEKLLFEFDLLGDDEEIIIENLLQAVERKLIQEKIINLQSNLRRGGEAEHTNILNEISTLKRREQELRQ